MIIVSVVRRIRLSLPILLWASTSAFPSSVAAPSPGSQELVLESPAIKLVLRADPAWRIASLGFPAAGFQIVPQEPIPLYQLEWYENGALEPLNPAQARIVEAAKTGGGITLRFLHEKEKLEILCKMKLAADGLHWEASFKNGSASGTPGRLRYPGIAMPPQKGGLDAALSMADGIRIRDVFGKLREGESREWEYPGLLSSQMTAWYGKSGGMVLYTADSAGYYKRFRVLRYRNHIIPTFEHIVAGFKDSSFAVPYPIVTAPFLGGWEAAADVYRRWAVGQPWCKKTLRERSLPAAVGQPGFFLLSHVRLDRGNHPLDESPTIPKNSEAFRQGLGMPIVNLFFSWEKHGPWVAPDYFPPYPDREGFDKMSRAIHAGGDKTMVFLSGLNVTLEKTARLGAPAYRISDSLQAALRPSAIVGLGGQTLVRSKAQEGVGKHWVLCPATAAAHSQLVDGVQRALDLGVDLIQIDQVAGGEVPACFREAHGHPLAGLNRVTHALAAILRDAHAKTSAKGAALSFEEPGEYFIPYLDIVHTRDFMEGAWPREGKGTEGIPLFSYLYHDYMLGYAGLPPLMGTGNLGMALYEQAIGLVAGRYPSGGLWMKRSEYPSLAPELKNLMQEIAAIWKSEAGEFLKLGQARRLPFVFPEQPISFNFSGVSHTFDVPTFLTMTYLLPGKEIAIFVNTTNSEQLLDLKSLAGSRNLGAIWPVSRAGKQLDTGKPLVVPSHQILILRRSV
jgi:hypothetical protein